VGVVAPRVGVSWVWAPDFVSFVRTQIGDHDGDGSILNGTRRAIGAVSSGSDLKAGSTS